MHFVRPQTYIVGYTAPDLDGLRVYLEDTDNTSFLKDFEQATLSGIHPAECLISFFAKLCYASLSLGHNENLSAVRDIKSNLISTHAHGHGSVWEHVSINFVTTNCSRVFTHELVRHRVGSAYSQTSGRYVRGDELAFVHDPILDPVKHHIERHLYATEAIYKTMVQEMGLDEMKDFDRKKKITSALRRILPNGQANEIGFTLNLRTLRHIIQARTSRYAEWEIRCIFADVYQKLILRFPMMFYGARVETVDGLPEVSGMKMMPYEAMPSTLIAS